MSPFLENHSNINQEEASLTQKIKPLNLIIILNNQGKLRKTLLTL